MNADTSDPAVPGQIVGFFHAGITVRDMDTALGFYRDVLGLPVAFDRVLDGPYLPIMLNLRFSGIRVAFLTIPGGGNVELLEYQGIERMPGPARPCDYGTGHLCFYVDDIDALHARALAHGFTSRSGEPVAITQGPNSGARAVYLVDPDGYIVELFQRPVAPTA